MVTEKACTKCGVTKPLSAFHANTGKGSGRSGLKSQCRACRREYDLGRYDKDKVRVQVKKWRHDNPEAQMRAHAKRKKFTPEEYIALATQGYCDICGVDCSAAPHVDHCHETNKLRGSLCCSCNTFLGRLEKRYRAGVLDRYLDYIKRGGFK